MKVSKFLAGIVISLAAMGAWAQDQVVYRSQADDDARQKLEYFHDCLLVDSSQGTGLNAGNASIVQALYAARRRQPRPTRSAI